MLATPSPATVPTPAVVSMTVVPFTVASPSRSPDHTPRGALTGPGTVRAD